VGDVIGDNMSSIQAVEAPPLTAASFPAVMVQNAQTIVIQTEDFDAYMSYSEGGLQQDATRFRIINATGGAGTDDSGIMLTFPLKPYSGLLYFASRNGASNAKVCVWQVSCGSSEY